MKSQVCVPCAKRKVKCDKGKPCSNCKRRKQDRCVYPEATPDEKIKRLETLVRSLGGNPENDPQPAPRGSENIPSIEKSSSRPRHDDRGTSELCEGGSGDPVILEEDGQSFYLESRIWHGWLGNSQDMRTKNPFSARDSPTAFQKVFCINSSTQFAPKYPSREDALMLWETFIKRVEPILRISFSWSLKQLSLASIDPERRSRFTDAEHGFVFSLYLISVVSLSDEDCKRELRQSRSVLLSEFQMLCEEALARTNLFCMTDVTVLKALTVYMMAGFDQLSNQSIWSLMGLTLRNAEKLGIHRDGTLLGLSPIETEHRRRLWWQLQHLDLYLAVKCGLTPLTLMADWDAKLPLNIEDSDINMNMNDFPNERKGLTSMSYNIYTYWVLDQQRSFFRSAQTRSNLSWQSNQSLPYPEKESFLNRLEDGLNEKFLQYCDPIKPTHILLQISARFLICGMRLRCLHPLALNSQQISEEHREALLDAGMKSLEYNIALHTQPSIKCFRWHTKAMFSWHAFMCVLVEASQQSDTAKIQQIWDLLSELYVANSDLSEIKEDRKRSHAAELIVAAWKARQTKHGIYEPLSKPSFVTNLEIRLSEYRAAPVDNLDANETQQPAIAGSVEPTIPDSFLPDAGTGAIFDLDFQDVDWSFWDSFD